MEIVVSHEGTDFDAFASMFAVTKLFPGTQIVLGGSVNRNVRHFLSLYGKFFQYLREKDIDWKQIKKCMWLIPHILSAWGRLENCGREEKLSF